jgi:signal transduction histidine kinase
MSSVATPGLGPSRWQRSLLPSVLLGVPGAPQAKRSLRDWFVDVCVFGLSLLIGALALGSVWSQQSVPVRIADLAVGTVCLALLWWRRRHPVGIAAFIVAVNAVFAFGGGAGLAMVFTVAAHRRPREVAGIAALAFTAMAIYPAIYPGEHGGYDVVGLVVGFLLLVLVIAWGLFVQSRRQLVLSLHDRAERLEAEQRLRVDQARRAERARIAREMHDVLAHRVSLLSVHAGALEFRPDAPPEEIARAAGVIRASAHEALRELRDVIGVLREDDAGDAAIERPQPTLAQVPQLVEESRAAGMDVALAIEPDGDEPLPDALGRTVFRIVQEGLTNARKHAAGAPVEVEIGGGREHGVTVAVRSDVPRPASATALPGAGTGLVGLAERVALAGGTLSHGPRPGGGFELRATLPWRE